MTLPNGPTAPSTSNHLPSLPNPYQPSTISHYRWSHVGVQVSLSAFLSAGGQASGARRLGWWGALEYKPPLVQTVHDYLTHLGEVPSRDADVDEKLTPQ